jgi:hypothetical protein
MILALVLYVLNFTKWSVCLSIDLCPTILLLGIGYTPPDEDADIPTHFLTFNVPTLRFEVQWCLLEDVYAVQAAICDDEESDD